MTLMDNLRGRPAAAVTSKTSPYTIPAEVRRVLDKARDLLERRREAGAIDANCAAADEAAREHAAKAQRDLDASELAVGLADSRGDEAEFTRLNAARKVATEAVAGAGRDGRGIRGAHRRRAGRSRPALGRARGCFASLRRAFATRHHPGRAALRPGSRQRPAGGLIHRPRRLPRKSGTHRVGERATPPCCSMTRSRRFRPFAGARPKPRGCPRATATHVKLSDALASGPLASMAAQYRITCMWRLI